MDHIIVEKELPAEATTRPEFRYCSMKKREDFKVDALRISRSGKKLAVDIFGERLGFSPAAPAPSMLRQAQERPSGAESEAEATILGPPLGLGGNPIDDNHYQELHNIERLEHGDILPGHRFVLGDLSTYSRELLIINAAESSALFPVLAAAREIGQKLTMSALEKALAVANLVDESFSSERESGVDGEAMTVGYFVEKGGWCRHRAAALQVALQEARVRSRYIRGKMEGIYHAWVEIDIKGDDSFAYVIDPMQRNFGLIEKRLFPKRESGDRKLCEYKIRTKTYLRLKMGATVWRPLYF